MARLGLSALKSLLRRAGLRRSTPAQSWAVPQASWSRPLGLGWNKPYSVRYASNLDDGPTTACLSGASAPAASAGHPMAT